LTVALGANPSGGTLSGNATVNARDGVATFNGLSVDRPGSGYTLTAAASGLAAATSSSFTVHLTFTSVDAGGNSNDAFDPAVATTCGVTTAGAAYCWGSTARGKLGNGIPWDGVARPTASPVLVAGGLEFGVVSVGEDYACGFTGSGSVYCWGQAFGGPPQASPVALPGGFSFTRLSAGNSHACGVTASTTAYCWGFNGTGELGDGTTTSRSSPSAPVAGGFSWGPVSAGPFRTCGVTTAGAAYCWGQGVTTPAPVAEGLRFRSVTSGAGHTCGVTTDFTAYCWGANSRGQLGDGTTTSHDRPEPVAGGLTFLGLDAGVSYTCGVTTSQTVYCWGENGQGQLGDGTTSTQMSPVPVAGGLPFYSVSAGLNHTCGASTNGRIYCWGANNYGQLGNGTTTSSSTPVAVV
jgi:alpha-tubulin suppressor-like RCC1 family protein